MKFEKKNGIKSFGEKSAPAEESRKENPGMRINGAAVPVSACPPARHKIRHRIVKSKGKQVDSGLNFGVDFVTWLDDGMTTRLWKRWLRWWLEFTKLIDYGIFGWSANKRIVARVDLAVDSQVHIKYTSNEQMRRTIDNWILESFQIFFSPPFSDREKRNVIFDGQANLKQSWKESWKESRRSNTTVF